MVDLTVFAGPSVHGVDPGLLSAQGVSLQAPARRGDIDRLIEANATVGVIVLADGVFQSAPAVSHAELCRALDRDWQVWGVSSLGAIRAFEMRGEGMRGHGYVYEQFLTHEDFTDDELCLLHLPEPPYTPLTEALVNVRYALACQGDTLGITAPARQRVITGLQALWFGDRTPERLLAQLTGDAGITPTAAQGLLRWLTDHRVKTIDLQTLLTLRPWAASQAGPG